MVKKTGKRQKKQLKSKAMDKFNWDNTFDMKETINEYNN